eukprot:UN32939
MSHVHYACLWKKTEVLSLLVKEKADVNTQDKLGETPLLSSIPMSNGELGVCKILLNARADVNICADSDGTSPLHRCAAYGFYDLAKLLLAANAEP